ncbi:MAG TPA: UDP-N-acetylglucosamine--N-acetylmuramyl-(pentapeptide) pyrophosphoryl-undecaprenol N-acetylglucosamine transferase [Candidatus Omnitrophota bacterium]|nr:UDP-N-acetylglucosamine--N-acetylmuramyl-(pentapeptide) pyrophosphoryl-undecaprenol N-acetylglucosamine transferase [Candidatus Omnitrophota bacterium]
MQNFLRVILVFSGPSGGHLFPAQAFAEAAHAESSDYKIVLVTSIRAQNLCLKFPAGIFSEIVFLPEFGSPIGFSFAGLRALLNIPVANIQSWNLLSRLKPDLCVGFGSFVSYFGMLFAAWRGIPTLIHEQNQVPGKATRMLQCWIKTIATSFPETAFRRKPREVVFTGLPIRREIRENRLDLNRKAEQPFTVLVCGGSQGSAFLNQAVLSAFSGFTAEERAQFAVIHIAGNGQDHSIREAYQRLGVSAEVMPFFEKMWLLYNRADMAVSRAGANSSFEQALYGIPTVFIPYPYAEGHQSENAKYFVDQKGALIVVQSEESAGELAAILRSWESRPESFREMGRVMRRLSFENGDIRLWNIAKNMLKLNTCNS